MAISLDKQTLIKISVGGLIAVVSSVATGSFMLSSKLSQISQMQQSIDGLQTKVARLSCRERELTAALDVAITTLEQITIFADNKSDSVHSRAIPPIQKLQRWVAQSDC